MLGAIALLAVSLRLLVAASELEGDLAIHDPSAVVKCDDQWWVFGTGFGILSRSSSDLRSWRSGPPVFTNAPAWRTNVAVRHNGRFWAPDVIRVSGRYLLYYSVSSWGSRESAIGLATNATLNPGSPGYQWHDGGLVVRTTTRDDHNAIDPGVTLDADGRLWMTFGSYWSGIKLVELNPATGLRLATNSPMHSLAWHESIEAACLYRHADLYYLLVNWGQCCRGTTSSYEITMGRSRAITGPYLDAEGKDMMAGGGSSFLSSNGDYVGPGHAGIVRVGDADWLSYHYYDRRNRGRSMLDLLPIAWSTNGWPQVQPRSAESKQSPR
jgi:arabinan endo-1,5-alpha-L-arabinosidase